MEGGGEVREGEGSRRGIELACPRSEGCKEPHSKSATVRQNPVWIRKKLHGTQSM
jgi:hypothetical protein